MAVKLPCSVQNFTMIKSQKWELQTNKFLLRFNVMTKIPTVWQSPDTCSIVPIISQTCQGCKISARAIWHEHWQQVIIIGIYNLFHRFLWILSENITGVLFWIYQIYWIIFQSPQLRNVVVNLLWHSDATWHQTSWSTQDQWLSTYQPPCQLPQPMLNCCQSNLRNIFHEILFLIQKFSLMNNAMFEMSTILLKPKLHISVWYKTK